MNLFIRADASLTIGTGHVMRCLALAQEWQKRGGSVTLVSTENIPSLEEQIRASGIDVLRISLTAGNRADADQTLALAKQRQASWIILDGYQFRAEFQRRLKASGRHVLVLDDYGHADYYWADIILNQNISAHEKFYTHREGYTQLLLGTRYTLLRQEFLIWPKKRKSLSDRACNVLVTLGGSDPDNQTLKILRAFQQMSELDFDILLVVGAGNPYFETLQNALKENDYSIRLIQNAKNIPELMQWADIAIAAAGTTVWELAFMGVPSILIVLTENQRLIAEHLGDIGISVNLGDAATLTHSDIIHAVIQLSQDSQKRSQMAKRGRELIDGCGAERIVDIMQNTFLTLREANRNDCQKLWQWSNESGVRTASFSQEYISWQQHTGWFYQKLHDLNSRIYLAYNKQRVAVGQVRYEIHNDQAVISVSLDKNYRGQGLGSILIKIACAKFFSSFNVETIHAYIKLNNTASAKSFISAGFTEFGIAIVNGCQALHLTLARVRT